MSSTLNMWNKLAEAESAAGLTVSDKLEDGWFTRGEYAAQRNCSSSAARERLEKLVAAGVLESKSIRLRVRNSVQTVRVWKLKDK